MWNHDHLILHNLIVLNRDAQVWGWFEWGPTWARHQSYAGLNEFQLALGLDTGGQALDPGFTDPLQRDFRLRAGTRERLQEQYPRGPVPGATREDLETW